MSLGFFIYLRIAPYFYPFNELQGSKKQCRINGKHYHILDNTSCKQYDERIPIHHAEPDGVQQQIN